MPNSAATTTQTLHSPAYSSRTSYTYATNTDNKRPRSKSKSRNSSLFSFIDPWNRRDHHIPLTPRSHRRSPQPILHTLLQYRRIPPLEYDLSLNPSHILVIHGQGYSELSQEQLDAPATNPPIRSMSITCDALPWTIQINSSNARIITVADVLGSLYRGLRSKASQTDWDRLPTDTKRGVREAWVTRYMRHQSLRQRSYEESQGLRRVDFLCGNLGFMGLTRISETSHDHRWLLHVGRVKRRVKFKANS